ncbi:hypothetical protein ACFGVR_10600 [Mucilaginibacter sp. AW1-3]
MISLTPNTSLAEKKAWQNGPELVHISHNSISTPAKSHPHVHESTGTTFIKTGVPFISNQASYSFQGTILQAIS